MEEECHQALLVKLKDKEQGQKTSVDEGGNSPTTNSITWVLIFSIFISVSGSFVYGCAWGYTSPVQSEIIADLGLSTSDYSLFVSMVTIGVVLGSLAGGALTDYIGHRVTMGISNACFLIGWLAVAYSQGAWSLDLGRLTLGVAAGICSYSIPVYVAEITSKNLRGGAVLLHQLLTSCGISFVYLVGLMTNWRVLALIGALTCLVPLLGISVIPESPRWLVKIGHDKKSEASLRRLRGENLDVYLEAAEIKECIRAVENIVQDKFTDVFQMKYAYALTISLGLMALAGLSGADVIFFYSTEVFKSAGVPATVGTATMALIQLPPTILGVFLMDNFGRRPFLLFSAAGMCTACISVAVSFSMKEHGWMEDSSPYLALIGILLCGATYPVGLGGIPNIIMSEIFPMNVKGAAGSLAIVVNSLSIWIVSYAFSFLMEWSSSGTFYMFASINVFSLLFVTLMVPETKGRTLEELQDLLT